MLEVPPSAHVELCLKCIVYYERKLPLKDHIRVDWLFEVEMTLGPSSDLKSAQCITHMEVAPFMRPGLRDLFREDQGLSGVEMTPT